MSESPANPATAALPAATVVIFRHAGLGEPPELLMVVRSRTMSFAGGAAVFPGGRIDDSDFELAARLDHDCDAEEAGARIAAMRETLEETGLAIGFREDISAGEATEARAILLECGSLAPVIEQYGWTPDLSELIPFARWFPKNERLPRVFDTRFYLHDLGTGAVDITVDETENTRLFWTSATDALAAAGRDEISVIFPTRRNLERLAQFEDFDAAARDAANHPVRTIIPFMEVRDDEPWICIPDDAGYPVTGERLATMRRG